MAYFGGYMLCDKTKQYSVSARCQNLSNITWDISGQLHLFGDITSLKYTPKLVVSPWRYGRNEYLSGELVSHEEQLMSSTEGSLIFEHRKEYGEGLDYGDVQRIKCIMNATGVRIWWSIDNCI